jgi:hypothetical protein
MYSNLAERNRVMQQQLQEVEQFENQVAQMLDLLDYEYGCKKRGPEVDIPPALAETYRRCIVQSRGVPAIRELTEWAIGILGSKLPDEACAQLFTAHKHLQERSEDGAYNALIAAIQATVLETPYADLTLTEAAAAACLVSTLMDMADLIVAGISADLSIRANAIKPTKDLWSLADGNGDLDALVEVLSRFFHIHGYKLGNPRDTTAEAIRALMEPDHQNGDLPGFMVAIWAATHGHLPALNESIVPRLAAMNAEYERKRPFIEAELNIQ